MTSTVHFNDCNFYSLIIHTFINMREERHWVYRYFRNVFAVHFYSVPLTLIYYWHKLLSLVFFILLILCCTFCIQRALNICTTELHTGLVLMQLIKIYGYFKFPLHFLNSSVTRCNVLLFFFISNFCSNLETILNIKLYYLFVSFSPCTALLRQSTSKF
jgi:hypothetical protein